VSNSRAILLIAVLMTGMLGVGCAHKQAPQSAYMSTSSSQQTGVLLAQVHIHWMPDAPKKCIGTTPVPAECWRHTYNKLYEAMMASK
jgi:Flp pilus assembly protein CpaB